MPCNSCYLAPTTLEQQLQNTAKLYVKFAAELGVKPTKTDRAAARDVYCSHDLVPALCKALRALGKERRDELLYGMDAARIRANRRLADWWEKHEEADQKRKRDDSRKKAEEKERQVALDKLTAREKRLLGLN